MFGSRKKDAQGGQTFYGMDSVPGASYPTSVPPGGPPAPGAPVQVNAADGATPALRDTFQSLRGTGVTSVNIAIDRSLVADDELVDLVEIEVRELAASCGIGIASVVRNWG
jgi:translation elongation factor EF-Tu-like GTPase